MRLQCPESGSERTKRRKTTQETRKSERIHAEQIIWPPRRPNTHSRPLRRASPKSSQALTGRAHFYQDHEWFLDFGEGFCAYKPPIDLKAHENVPDSVRKKPHLTLSWITPHSKWGIHSSYQDNLRMLNLFRGGPYVWLSEEEAATIGIRDNDWVEAINANGATVCRAVVSQRVPRGMALMYHAQEKNVNVPGSNTTGKRGGILNSVTRVIVKPTNMVGGYAQLAYSFNYYGTVGCQRDEVVVIHKIEDQDIDWLERPLTPEREAALNPPGIGPR